MKTSILIAVFGYMIFTLLIGYIFTQKASKSWKNFFLMGKGMNWSIFLATVMASNFSAVVMTGAPSQAYKFGITAAVAYSLCFALRSPLAYIARIVRRHIPEDATTIVETIHFMYNSESVTFLSIILVIFYNVSRFATQILAIGILLNFLTGIPVATATIIGGIVVILYTLLSGLYGVAITDVFQMVFMVFAWGIAIFVGWNAVGGWVGLKAALPTSHFNLASGGGMPWSSWTGLILGIALYFYCDPNVFQRFYAAKTETIATRGFIIVTMLWTLCGTLTMYNGLIIRALYPNLTAVTDGIYDFMLVKMPTYIGVFWIAGLLGGFMSTADTHILLAASDVSKNIYQRYINRKATDDQLILVTRIAIPFVTVAGVVLAQFFPGVWSIFSILTNGYTAGMFAPLILGFIFFIKGYKLNKLAALITTVGGSTSYFYLLSAKILPQWPAFLVVLAFTVGIFIIMNIVSQQKVSLETKNL